MSRSFFYFGPSQLTRKYSGNNLLKHRQKAQLTQKELAVEVGVSQQVISVWEQGKGYPTLAHAVKVREALYKELLRVRRRRQASMELKQERNKRLAAQKRKSEGLQAPLATCCHFDRYRLLMAWRF